MYETKIRWTGRREKMQVRKKVLIIGNNQDLATAVRMRMLLRD
jgi:hypothetical protein